jgi:putative ABC transport system permease protein
MHGKIPLPDASSRPASVLTLARLAFRLALRDLSGGLRGFGVFIACLALGVAAIAAVTSTARGVGEGLSREGKRILGGDAAFSLTHREASNEERAFLAARGAVSVMATMRAMVVAGEKGTALVEIKAVDASYPTVGEVVTEPARPLAELFQGAGGKPGVLVDPLVLARLDLKAGETVRIGEADVVVMGALISEPDKVAAGVGLGPRLLMTEAALRTTGLVQPGSLIRWSYRVNFGGDEAASAPALAALEADARRLLPEAGWDIRTRANADPRFARNIDRFSQFLTLVGLTALLVGGVGVANAVRRFVDMKRMDFATLKALGAPGSQVVAIHLIEVMLVACIGVGIGVVAGAALPYLLAGLLNDVLPLPLSPTIAWTELGIAALYGLVTALVFALLPLGQAHDTPVSALFRDVVDAQDRRPRWPYLLAFGAALAAMVGITILFAYDGRIATIYIAVIAAAYVMLRLVGSGIMRLAAALPRSKRPSLRMAVANMHRPGALTPALVLSLGLGVALLSALAFIDVSLNRALTQNLPARAPSYFFLDIPSSRTAEFDAFAKSQVAGAEIERVPLMRGRVVALNGVPAERIKVADRFGWVLEGDRGITYSADLPRDSSLVSGSWWAPDHRGEALLSFDHELAQGLGLSIGDQVTVNVLGRNVTARLANTRKVEWRNLGINFVMLFSPNSFAGAPHTHLATLTLPEAARAAEPGLAASRDALMLRELSRAFPAVTAVRVKDALDAANDLVGKLTLAIRAASFIAVAASLLVLAGALAAGQRARLYDAMILKTLGATRARILGAYGAEYALTGFVAAAFGLIAGIGAGWAVTTRAMNIAFVFAPASAILLALGTVAIAVIFGLLGTLRILSKKPASYLRSL